MNTTVHAPHAALFEWAAIVFWITAAVFEFRLKQRAPRFLAMLFWLPGKFVRLFLIIVTLGVFLSACAAQDPLAVAHGPLFPLNAGHWQPSPQDLNAPPKIAEN